MYAGIADGKITCCLQRPIQRISIGDVYHSGMGDESDVFAVMAGNQLRAYCDDSLLQLAQALAVVQILSGVALSITRILIRPA